MDYKIVLRWILMVPVAILVTVFCSWAFDIVYYLPNFGFEWLKVYNDNIKNCFLAFMTTVIFNMVVIMIAPNYKRPVGLITSVLILIAYLGAFVNTLLSNTTLS